MQLTPFFFTKVVLFSFHLFYKYDSIKFSKVRQKNKKKQMPRSLRKQALLKLKKIVDL